MPVQRQELEILIKALTDPSVGQMAQQVVVSIKQIQSNIQGLQKEAQNTTSAFGNMASGVIGFMRDVAATAAGILVRDVVIGGLRLLRDAILDLGKAMFETNAIFDQTTTAIAVMAGGQEKANLMMEAAAQVGRDVGRSYSEMVQLAQPLIPFAQGSSKALQELLRASLSLQAYMPEKGAWGAVRAITEAMADQYMSLARLYNIPLRTIQELKDEGLRGLDLVMEALKRMGVGWDIVAAQANTFLGMLTSVKGVAQDFFRLLGQAIFKEFSNDLRVARDWLMENREAIMGLAQAIGTGLADAYRAARSALADLIGVQELNLDDVVQWGANFIASLVNGILDGVDRYLMPALIAVASLIASFLAGASPPERGPLSNIVEGGRRMLEAYIDGILSSDAPEKLKEVAEKIRRELLQEERVEALRRMVEEAQRRGAQIVEAAQKRVVAAQKEVEEATKRVQAAQERLNEFAETHAEIPERFTRARKRQLEEELRAIQKEQRQKQDAVKVAQDALKIAQDQAKAIIDAAREHERAVKDQMASIDKLRKFWERLQKAEEDAGYGAEQSITGQIETAGDKIKEMADKYGKMIGDIFAGKDIGEKWTGITEQFKTFSGILAGVDTNLTAISVSLGLIASALELVTAPIRTFLDLYDKLPPWMKTGLESQMIPKALMTGGIPIGPALEAIEGLVGKDVMERFKKGLDILPSIIGNIFFGPLGSVVAKLTGGKPEMQKAVDDALINPIKTKAQEVYDWLVGRSLIPDMLDAIVKEYERLRDEVWPVVEDFARDVADAFEELADFVEEQMAGTVEWVTEYAGDMGLAFKKLTIDVNALRVALERLNATMARMPTLPQIPSIRPTPSPRNLAPASLAGAGGLAGALGSITVPIDQRGWHVGPGIGLADMKRVARDETTATILDVLETYIKQGG